MSSIKTGQNRVKSITSRFEVLNEQNVDKPRDQKLQLFKTNSDSFALESARNVENDYNASDETFGPSCNFGNRKRLKQIEIVEKSSAGATVNSLSRQNSDPIKKLQRTPAFRCDRNSKLQGSMKSDEPATNRTEKTRARLKQLGNTIQERLMHDDMTFSQYGRVNNKDRKSAEPVGEISDKSKKHDDVIPQHVLDMYAKVLKPKNRNEAAVGGAECAKSDSGVSSESENPPMEDLDKANMIPKNGEIDRSTPENDVSDEEFSAFAKDKSILLDGVASVETLKKILKEPLPVGPPPKKPPRTFASSMLPEVKSSPPKRDDPLHLDLKSKIKKSPRSKEESRLMLDKIENAFLKHQTAGKIITPRVANENEAPTNNYHTHPSKALLKQPNRNKKEVHYMCTELFDQNATDRSAALNSSDGSVTSSEDLHNAKSFVECLGALNCSSARRNSGFSYSKFGSHSANNSLVETCCSCNRGDKCKSSLENLILTTFSNSQSASDTEPAKCKTCGLNERRDNQFKCHVDCNCRLTPKGNSTFFIGPDSPGTPPSPGHYGVLKKSKSQEHIYDEPIVLRNRRTNEHLQDSGKENGHFLRNDFKSKTLIDTKSQRWNRKSENGLNQHLEAEISQAALEATKDRRPLSENGFHSEESHPKRDDVSKKPPLSRSKRPNHLEVKSDDIDKRKLNSLISEIYDTVNVTCALESPLEDQFHNANHIERDFHNEYRNYENIVTNPMTNSNQEMADASLKLTRNLTEKRKEYVRRVSSRRGEFPATINVKNSKFRNQKSLPNRHPYGTFSDKESFLKIKSLFEKSIPDDDINYNKEKIEIPRIETTNSTDNVENRLFEICAVIGWNFNTGRAYIKSVFPENATLPPQTESLVFPESCNMESNSQSFTRNTSIYRKARCETLAEDSQLYSLILTNEDGRRSYGYCRRVVPEGAPFCLPLAYCIISNYKAPKLYYEILEEIESHHGSSDIITKSILTQLYNQSFPKAGCSLSLKNWRAPKDNNTSSYLKKNSLHRSSLNLGNDSKFTTKSDVNLNLISEKLDRPDKNVSQRRKSTDLSQKFPNVLSGQSGASMIKSLEKIYGRDQGDNRNIQKTDNDKNKNCSSNANDNFIRELYSKNSVLNRSFITNINKGSGDICRPSEIQTYSDINIKRSLEPRIDDDNLFTLFDTISVDILLKIFGSLLLERKVIIVGDKLSKLSACIEGLQSILYPFIWQHTLISTIPTELRKIIFEAPIPILAGVFCPVDPDPKIPDSKKNIKCKNSDASKSTTLPNNNTKIPRDLKEELDLNEFDEGIVVDISSYTNKCKSCVIQMQGDESTILPPSLSKTLRTALQLGSHISFSNTQPKNCSRKSINILVSEAFLRFFTTFLGDYRNYLIDNTTHSTNNESNDLNKSLIFDREGFIKSFSSKHIQLFLEWFTETSMFHNFSKDQITLSSSCSKSVKIVLNSLPHPDFYDILNERIALVETMKKEKEISKLSSVNKNNYKSFMNKKMKVWRDKLKDLIN